MRIAPDILRVVFDPAGRGIVLRQLAPGTARRAPVHIEGQNSRGGGALIDRENVAVRHDSMIRAGPHACSSRAWLMPLYNRVPHRIGTSGLRMLKATGCA